MYIFPSTLEYGLTDKMTSTHPTTCRLECRENGISARDGDTRTGLRPNIFHNEVIDDKGIAASTGTQAMGREIEDVAYLLGPSNISVSGGDDLVFEALDTRPAAQDERVVGGDDDDDIDSLGLELVVLLDVRRQMVHMTSGGEGSGNSKEDDLLPLPVIGGECRGDSARKAILELGRVWHVFEGALRNSIADGECHIVYSG